MATFKEEMTLIADDCRTLEKSSGLLYLNNIYDTVDGVTGVVGSAINAVIAKGGTVASPQTYKQLVAGINSIPTGMDISPLSYFKAIYYTPPAGYTYVYNSNLRVTHGLGVTPSGYAAFAISNTETLQVNSVIFNGQSKQTSGGNTYYTYAITTGNSQGVVGNEVGLSSISNMLDSNTVNLCAPMDSLTGAFFRNTVGYIVLVWRW